MLKWALLIFAVTVGCATSPQKTNKLVQSPENSELAPMNYYPGQWEMDQCLHDGKQAERVQIATHQGELVLQRWQRGADKDPLFTAAIKPGEQTEVSYQSKDFDNSNPVLNKTQWSWMGSRIVSNMLLRPAQGDLRGNWTAVVSGQFYIKKDQPHRLHWSRWGSSHSARHGQQKWESECIYRRASELAIESDEAEDLQLDLSKINQASLN